MRMQSSNLFVLCATLSPVRHTVNHSTPDRDYTVACICDNSLLRPGMAVDSQSSRSFLDENVQDLPGAAWHGGTHITPKLWRTSFFSLGHHSVGWQNVCAFVRDHVPVEEAL